MQNISHSIEVKHLKKSYKNVEVLRDVTFSVEYGKIFALLGANGSGKTTTINILTTLIKADDGMAKVNGFDVVSEAESVRKSISLTGQFAAVDEVLTGRENLVMIAELRHVEDPAQTAEDLLKQFDLIDAADRRTSTYSGGMRRRLDIAMSLIGDPKIIFLDEPTTGLDLQSRNLMWKKIKTLAKNGTTVFLTTQYLEEADQLADTISILNQGRIVAEGSAEELKKLLPCGKIEFRFHEQGQLNSAIKLFDQYDLIPNKDNLSLAVVTDGSVSQISQFFNMLQLAHIEIAEFSQKVPTLDEAFLKIIGEKKEIK